MSTQPHHGRTVWAEPDELSGRPYDSDFLTTRVPLTTFALNRDRGSDRPCLRARWSRSWKRVRTGRCSSAR